MTGLGRDWPHVRSRQGFRTRSPCEGTIHRTFCSSAHNPTLFHVLAPFHPSLSSRWVSFPSPSVSPMRELGQRGVRRPTEVTRRAATEPESGRGPGGGPWSGVTSPSVRVSGGCCATEPHTAWLSAVDVGSLLVPERAGSPPPSLPPSLSPGLYQAAPARGGEREGAAACSCLSQVPGCRRSWAWGRAVLFCIVTHLRLSHKDTSEGIEGPPGSSRTMFL